MWYLVADGCFNKKTTNKNLSKFVVFHFFFFFILVLLYTKHNKYGIRCITKGFQNRHFIFVFFFLFTQHKKKEKNWKSFEKSIELMWDVDRKERLWMVMDSFRLGVCFFFPSFFHSMRFSCSIYFDSNYYTMFLLLFCLFSF